MKYEAKCYTGTHEPFFLKQPVFPTNKNFYEQFKGKKKKSYIGIVPCEKREAI